MRPRQIWSCAALLALLALPSSALAASTHYWTWRETPEPEDLRAAIAAMAVILVAAPDLAAGADGTGRPQIRDTSLTLNGVGEHRGDVFRFPGELPRGSGPAANRVRTSAGEPLAYDAVVTACLIVARDHFAPEVLAIGSDGTWEDWRPGRDLYRSAKGSPAVPALGGELRADAPAPAEAATPAPRPAQPGRSPGRSRLPSPIVLGIVAAAVGFVGYHVWKLLVRAA